MGTQGAHSHADCPNHPHDRTTAAAAPEQRCRLSAVGCRLSNAAWSWFQCTARVLECVRVCWLCVRVS